MDKKASRPSHPIDMNKDKLFLVLLAISAAIFTAFFFPYLDGHGFTWACVLYYVVVSATFIYGGTAYSLRQRRER